MSDETYIALVTREFSRMKHLADGAIRQASSDHLFTSPDQTDNSGDNSMAIIVKHITGNLFSRWKDFLTSDGEKHRDRDAEFVLSVDDTREHLLGRWEEGWRTLFDTMSSLIDSDLNRTVTIRGEPFTALQAINRQLTHYAYHIGQLVFLAKHFAGAAWVNLSIPRGESESFNRNPAKYLSQ